MDRVCEASDLLLKCYAMRACPSGNPTPCPIHEAFANHPRSCTAVSRLLCFDYSFVICAFVICHSSRHSTARPPPIGKPSFRIILTALWFTKICLLVHPTTPTRMSSRSMARANTTLRTSLSPSRAENSSSSPASAGPAKAPSRSTLSSPKASADSSMP